ncbi:hypothetical protein FSARC_4350 [Fusarium sarcochroum]|uniref:Uncharacterized protein n=1 Tax=Fusarium sarcochroum TaxID=1208366 RepID=A0A8H4U2H0_9HYPO|nr:hypothetical protein FSARC_4350 [Fusarium sarcochroum]
MVKRTLVSAFRPLAGLRVSLAESATQTRHFSASSVRGLSAVFAETENPELNEVLIKVQEKIILPAYLPPTQRELVFDPKKSTFIQQNPVIIELDGLEHKFSTIDRFTEVPNSKKAFHEVVDLMKTKEDWDNLGTLLAGYKKAGIRLHRDQYARMIRQAGVEGQPYTIIECAKQAQKTGLYLKYKDWVVILLTHINEKIIKPNGEGNDALHALKWNMLVWDLIQRHLPGFVNRARQYHLSPDVRGLFLFAQASAIQAQQAAEAPAEELVQALRDNAQFIVSSWNHKDTDDLFTLPLLAKLNPRARPNSPNRHGDLSPNYYIWMIAQNIRGMELAQEIIGDEAKGLDPIRKALEQHLRDFIKKDEHYREGWATTYEETTGRKPDWSK